MNDWRKLQALVGIQLVFFLLELFTGLMLHSLTLIGDSFHVFSDLLSLGVAMAAMKLSQTKPDAKYTYGLRRAEVLGALINAFTLLYLCLTLVVQATKRLFEPEEILNPKFLALVGAAGLVSNIFGLLIFEDGHGHGHSHGGGSAGGHSHSHAHSTSAPETGLLPDEALAQEESQLLRNYENYGSDTHANHFHSRAQVTAEHKRPLNMDGVYLHVLSDVINNVVVIVLGLFVWLTNFSWKYYADPVLCMLMAVLISWSTIPLCIRAAKVLLNATPASVNASEVREDVKSLPGIASIHELHIWQLNDVLLIATMHVTVCTSPSEFGKLSRAIHECLSGHGISTVTIQPEFIGLPRGSHECVTYGNTLAGGLSTDDDHE